MNNQWRDNANLMVVWADGTYDSKRSCDECGLEQCKNVVHTDQYKEVGNDPLLVSDASEVMGYWSWMSVNKPLGSKQDFDGEWVHTETHSANPDGLAELMPRTSGITEEQFKAAQEAYATLTPRQQEVWNLVMRQQMSITDAGASMNPPITKQAVEQCLSRAKTVFINILRGNQ